MSFEFSVELAKLKEYLANNLVKGNKIVKMRATTYQRLRREVGDEEEWDSTIRRVLLKAGYVGDYYQCPVMLDNDLQENEIIIDGRSLDEQRRRQKQERIRKIERELTTLKAQVAELETKKGQE